MDQRHHLIAQDPTDLNVLSFVVAVEPVPGGAVIRLTGELDLQGAAVLAARTGELPVGGAVAIDLRGLSFLDTSGLAALVELHGSLTGRGCGVRLLGPRGRVLRLLDLAVDAGWLSRPVDCPERPDWALAPQAAAG